MIKTLSALALLGKFAVALPAAADDTLARFKGGIGVDPVSSGVAVPATTTSVVVNRNFVRGVTPPGQLWVIKDLDAKVRANGQISVKGKGLILAGGDNAGRAPTVNVFATLICEATAPFTLHSTTLAGVPLPPNGDFKIDDVLSPAVPFTCASPMLLIRNAAGGAWFAAGIPADQDDND